CRVLCCYAPGRHVGLLAFPTRRSSDLPGADPDGVPARPRLAGLRPLAALVLDRRRDRSADGAWRGLATKSDAGVGRSLIRIRPEKNQPSVRLVFSIQGRKHKRHEWVVITLALKLFPARPR